jgi:4-amino-4-deoxychorismate lyase
VHDHTDSSPAPDRIVAVLGRGMVPPGLPILRADDLGALRGDGIFETMHVRGGRPWMLDEHLARMARSAVRLELDLPSRDALAALVDTTLGGWPPAVEGALRVVCTRGPESGGDVTVYATVTGIPPSIVRSRQDGITVATASLGFAADARQHASWLLGGAKTVSYAVNMASQRWALTQGADDVLWTSSDGYALEGPTSTLIWRDGNTLCSVPAAGTGILAGTTARWLLDHAAEAGLRADERMTTPSALLDADGVWFASSVRGVVEIRAIDGEKTHAATDTDRLRGLLGFPA